MRVRKRSILDEIAEKYIVWYSRLPDAGFLKHTYTSEKLGVEEGYLLHVLTKLSQIGEAENLGQILAKCENSYHFDYASSIAKVKAALEEDVRRLRDEAQELDVLRTPRRSGQSRSGNSKV